MRYEIARAATLAETIVHGDAPVRIKHVAAVSAALPGWWRALGHGSGFMPADVAFDHSEVPHLLSLPTARPPDIVALLEHSARAVFLPPEVIRGREELLSERSDRYALGVCLLHCVYRVAPAADGAETLLRAAAGLALAKEQLSPALRSPRQYDVADGFSSPASPSLSGFHGARIGAPPLPHPMGQ